MKDITETGEMFIFIICTFNTIYYITYIISVHISVTYLWLNNYKVQTQCNITCNKTHRLRYVKI